MWPSTASCAAATLSRLESRMFLLDAAPSTVRRFDRRRPVARLSSSSRIKPAKRSITIYGPQARSRASFSSQAVATPLAILARANTHDFFRVGSLASDLIRSCSVLILSGGLRRPWSTDAREPTSSPTGANTLRTFNCETGIDPYHLRGRRTEVALRVCTLVPKTSIVGYRDCMKSVIPASLHWLNVAGPLVQICFVPLSRRNMKTVLSDWHNSACNFSSAVIEAVRSCVKKSEPLMGIEVALSKLAAAGTSGGANLTDCDLSRPRHY